MILLRTNQTNTMNSMIAYYVIDGSRIRQQFRIRNKNPGIQSSDPSGSDPRSRRILSPR